MTDTDLAQFLAGAGDKHYRDLVRYHIKKQSPGELQAAVLGEVSLMPEALRSLVDSYIDCVNDRFGYDKNFWETATCKAAFIGIMRLAIEHFPLSGVIESAEDALLSKNHDLVFRLFQIPTLSFAYSASLEPKQREFMGIHEKTKIYTIRSILVTGILGLLLFGIYFMFGEAAAEYTGAIILGGAVLLAAWRFWVIGKQRPG